MPYQQRMSVRPAQRVTSMSVYLFVSGKITVWGTVSTKNIDKRLKHT